LVSGSWPSAAPAKLSWLRTPTGADYAYYYPERAIRNEVTGRASLHCVVKADGYVTDCKVISETPSGYNFGEASLRVSSKFQMPTMVDGKSTEGSEVTIPLFGSCSDP
jgi:protein TonB